LSLNFVFVTGLKYRVIHENQLELFKPTGEDLSQLQAYVLIETTEEGTPTGGTRLAVHGEEHLVCNFTGKQIFEDSEMAKYSFQLTVSPSKITFIQNSVVTEWIDIKDMVLKHEIQILDTAEMATEKFLERLNILQEKDYKQGAVFRWAIHASASMNLILVLQSLPASRTQIKTSGKFPKESCPAVAIGKFNLVTQSDKHFQWKIPTPVFCSKTPEKTLVIINEDPSAALTGDLTDLAGKI
jgi:hypothetical protein